MFEQVRELNKLRKQAGELKREMERITVEVAHGKVKILMRGDQTVEKIEVEDEERADLRDAFNKAVKESQKKVAQKLSGMVSGMQFPKF